jgi:hypothetical protein
MTSAGIQAGLSRLSFLLLAGFGYCLLAGSGISLWLSGEQESPVAALASAPVVGFFLVGWVSTLLVFLGFPVSQWFSPVALGLALMGILTAAFFFAFRRPALRAGRIGDILPGAAAFFLALALMAFPPVLGGMQYSVFRGNKWDTFSYAAMASCLDGISWGHLSGDSVRVLLDHQPAATLFRNHLLGDRITSGLSLDFFSRLAGTPPLDFFYAFSLLCQLLAFPLIYRLSRNLRLPAWMAALLSATCLAGFWGQFLLDSNALSQLNSLPFLMLFALSAEEACFTGGWRPAFRTGLALAGLWIFYVETIPLTLVFLGLAVWRPGGRARRPLWTPLVLGAFLAIPFLPYYGRLLSKQFLLSAHAGTMNWAGHFYAWLFQAHHPFRFLPSFWGLFHFQDLEDHFPSGWPWISAVCYLLSVVLSFLVGKAWLARLRKKDAGNDLMGPWLWTFTLFFIFFLARRHYWVAGKALSNMAPFALLAAAGVAWEWDGSMGRIVRILLLFWVVGQLATGLYRIRTAAAGADFQRPYVVDEGKGTSFEIGPVQEALAREAPGLLAVDVADPWLTERIAFGLRNEPVLSLGPIYDYHSVGDVSWAQSREIPQWLLSQSIIPAGRMVVETPTLKLCRMTPEDWDRRLEHFEWPSGGDSAVRLEGLSSGPSGWELGEKGLSMHFLSAGRAMALYARLKSRDLHPRVEAFLDGGSIPVSTETKGRDGVNLWRVALSSLPGTHELKLRSSAPGTLLTLRFLAE